MSSPIPREPVGPWVGRLIFDPTSGNRTLGKDDGVSIELQHAPPEYRRTLVGTIVALRWQDTPRTREYLEKTIRDVHFTSVAFDSAAQGNLHPTRLDSLQQVGPLESLAGSRPENDVHVILQEPKYDSGVLYVQDEPIQTSGVFYSVVTIRGRSSDKKEENISSDLFTVQHFDPNTKSFSGAQEVVRIPQYTWDADNPLCYCKSSNDGIEHAACNDGGWYIYGDTVDGVFVVQAIEPRLAIILEPNQVITISQATARRFITTDNWAHTPERQGTLETTLIDTHATTKQDAIQKWQEGDRLLVIHLFGGIKGPRRNESKMGLVTGHFAYGNATIIRDPLTKELRFDIEYSQVYAHNSDRIISGRTKRHFYMGDLNIGWLGCRPVSDILVDIDLVTKDYHFGDNNNNSNITLSPYTVFQKELAIMMARYRVGDGTGASLVDAARSCVQDSNQALYVALDEVEDAVQANPEIVAWLEANPQDVEAIRFQKLSKMGDELHNMLAPFGSARSDWRRNADDIHIVEKQPAGIVRSMVHAVKSICTVIPRRSHDVMARFLLDHEAAQWFIRTNQVGGENHDVGPIAPTTSGGLSFCT